MKKLSFYALALFVGAMTSCGGSGSNDEALAAAASLADSIAQVEAGGKVVAAAPNLEATFTLADPEICVEAIGQNLFEVYASQQLKRLNGNDVGKVCSALKASRGSFVTILNSPGGESATFTLSAGDLDRLWKAKNSQLNLGAARNEVIAVAERMQPNAAAHAGAARVEVAVSKGFLEYNVVWPKASAYAGSTQGLLTKNYFNALKEQYQAMGGMGPGVVELLVTLGIDGVRIAYTAEDSDRELKQAFPWREIKEAPEK